MLALFSGDPNFTLLKNNFETDNLTFDVSLNFLK